MKIVKSSWEFITPIEEIKGIEKKIEKIARVCYKSEDKITPTSHQKLLDNLLNLDHTAMIEHASISVKIVCDRGISHEWVRHRIASYAQESTRYCSYNKDKFGNEITVIEPTDETGKILYGDPYDIWKDGCEHSEKIYFKLLENGIKPQIARNVLPTSLKTELVCTMNLRSWMNFLFLRTAATAHPQIRETALKVRKEFEKLLPVIFKDRESAYKYDFKLQNTNQNKATNKDNKFIKDAIRLILMTEMNKMGDTLVLLKKCWDEHIQVEYVNIGELQDYLDKIMKIVEKDGFLDDDMFKYGNNPGVPFEDFKKLFSLIENKCFEANVKELSKNYKKLTGNCFLHKFQYKETMYIWQLVVGQGSWTVLRTLENFEEFIKK